MKNIKLHNNEIKFIKESIEASEFFGNEPKLCRRILKKIDKALTIPSVMYRCKLVKYGDEEKRCVKCGYIAWNNDKTDNEIIEDMIKSGYDVPDCGNGCEVGWIPKQVNVI